MRGKAENITPPFSYPAMINLPYVIYFKYILLQSFVNLLLLLINLLLQVLLKKLMGDSVS
jgi:hypothetical protein